MTRNHTYYYLLGNIVTHIRPSPAAVLHVRSCMVPSCPIVSQSVSLVLSSNSNGNFFLIILAKPTIGSTNQLETILHRTTIATTLSFPPHNYTTSHTCSYIAPPLTLRSLISRPNRDDRVWSALFAYNKHTHTRANIRWWSCNCDAMHFLCSAWSIVAHLNEWAIVFFFLISVCSSNVESIG